MKDIYTKIQMTEQYLCDLRLSLERAEKEAATYGPAAGIPIPDVLAALAQPFLESAFASAKAAALSGGAKLR